MVHHCLIEWMPTIGKKDTLNLFYKQDLNERQVLKQCDSRCLIVAYFLTKVLNSQWLFSRLKVACFYMEKLLNIEY